MKSYLAVLGILSFVRPGVVSAEGTEVSRCAGEDRILDRSLAQARLDWALKCEVLEPGTYNWFEPVCHYDPRTGRYHCINREVLLYPTFGTVPSDDAAPAFVVAPVDADASCIVTEPDGTQLPAKESSLYSVVELCKY